MVDLYRKFTPNGTNDDFISLIIRANSLLYAKNGTPIPTKSRFSRLWIEPIGNLLGLAITATAWLLPAKTMGAIQHKLFAKLAAPLQLPFDPKSPNLIAARQLAASIQTQTHRPPATLCLFEHPPVEGELLQVNITLSHHAFSALNWLQSKPRAKLVVATDSLALEHWSMLAEGVYAGFMGTYHLGFDRLSTHRRGLSRLLIGKTTSNRMAFRISSALHRRAGLAMAPAGGVPSTGRALYTAREYLYVLRQQRDHSITPDQVLIRLREISADFTAFQYSGLTGASLQRSAWKMMEAWIVALLSGAWNFDMSRQDPPCVNTGLLCATATTALTACAQAMGVANDIADSALTRFREHFRRQNPQRIRLFRLLAQRVVANGTPLLLLPLTAGTRTSQHSLYANVKMTWGEPVVLKHYHHHQLTIGTIMHGQYSERTLSITAFVKEFNHHFF